MSKTKIRMMIIFLIGFLLPLSVFAGDAEPVTNFGSMDNMGFVSVSDPAESVMFNGKLYFSGRAFETGSELCVYDGILPAKIVVDLDPGWESGINPMRFTVYNNKLYFTSSNCIYQYDGVNTPTLISSHFVWEFVVFNGSLYFCGNGSEGNELWKYSGSGSPTLVEDIYPGGGDSLPRSFCVADNKLYFAATHPTYGREIFVYDGTNPVQLAADVTPGSMGSNPESLKEFNGKMYFWYGGEWEGSSDYELGTWDFTNPATMLMDINPAGGSFASDFVEFNNRLYFFANDGSHGYELWSLDHTNSPQMVQDVFSGNNTPDNISILNGKLYYGMAYDGGNAELWSCNASNSVSKVCDIPTKFPPFIGSVVELNGSIHFMQGDSIVRFADPALFLTYPNGGERWKYSTDKPVTWTADSSILNVDIHASSDGGQTWNLLAGSVPNTGSYTITAPATHSMETLLKISDSSGSASDVSNNFLNVSQYGIITINTPMGSETWSGGSQQTIGWMAPPEISDVNIWFSDDDGVKWSTVAGPVANSGTYNWTVPAVGSTNCRIKVEDANGFEYDISNKFSIENGQFLLTILSPNGGEIYGNGGYMNINWTVANAAGNELMDVEFSTDNGSTWSFVGQWEVNYPPPDWYYPATESSNCMIRITETTGKGSDTSDAPFTVETPKSLIVTSPGSGEVYIVGNTYEITWSSVGSIANVRVMYSLDSWQTWNEAVATTPNTGSYMWTVPVVATPATDCAIKLEDADSAYAGLESQSFKILSDQDRISTAERNALIALYNSTNGDGWTDNSNWRNPANLSEFNLPGTEGSWFGITLSADYKHVERIILSGKNLTGTIPDLSALTHLTRLDMPFNNITGPLPDLSAFTQMVYLIFTDNQISGPIPTSIGNLVNLQYLSLGSNQLTGPLPDEIGNLVMLKDFTLKGNMVNGQLPAGLVNLTNLYTFGLWFSNNALHTNDPALLNFVESHHNPTRPFEVNQTIAPLNPIFSNVVDNTVQISWDPVALQSISGGYEVWLSTTQGSGYQLEATLNDLNQVSHTLTNLEYGTTYYCVVKTFHNPHTDNDNMVHSDLSAEVSVTIAAPSSFTVTAPNGGESLEAVSAYNITWTNTGTVTDVKLEYSTDNGGTWTDIFASVSNTGSYNWTVPNAVSSQCYIRVGETDGSTFDTNDTVFSIVPQRTITVTAPNGGENFTVGDTTTITWNYTGAVNFVNIDLSIDSGSTWNSIVANTANSGTYNWTVPDSPSGDCLVRVSDAGGTAWDTGDVSFTISVPSVSQAERNALIAFYNSTDGDNWTDNTNWRKPGAPTEFNDPGTEHTWFGIQTDAGHTIVTSIALNNNNLTGPLPDLNSFTELGHIELSNNNLSGTVATQLNTLTKATYINLSFNQFSGSFPDLSGNTLLQNLLLENNQFSGSIPTWLNNFSLLANVNLEYNQLSGAIPDLSGTDLWVFKLGSNSLTGTIPAWLNQMTRLETLSLYSNALDGSIPDLSSLTALKNLYLSNNNLSGSIPSGLNAITALESLNLSGNSLTGSTPDMSGLSNLKTLNLEDNQLNGTIPAWLNSITALTTIDLQKNSFSGSIPDLSNLTGLRGLFLQDNQLTGTIPASLNTNTLLGSLELAGNQLSGGIPDLSALTSLLVLNLQGNSLSGDPLAFGYLPAVQWLQLQNNNFSGTIPAAIGNLTTVRILHLSGNMFSGEIPTEITNLTGLEIRELDLRYNALYSTNSTVRSFVDAKAGVWGWEDTQTIAPSALTITDTTEDSITLSWDAIPYTADSGRYDVYYHTSPAAGGDYSGFTLAGSTADKTTTTYTVTGLEGDTQYYIIVKAVSNAHANNTNTIESAAGTEVSGTTLISKSITVTTPNGGETWEATTPQNITWTHTGAIADVKLEYSTDNGSSWNVIIASTANNGTYNWPVPNSPSASCLIKVSDTAGPATDGSNAVFTIAAQRTVTVTSPNGGENYTAGNSETITWNYTGTINFVNIDYSTDSGSTWNSVTANVSNSGSNSWTIPDTPSSDSLVRVSDTADGSISDVSNVSFTISQPTISTTERNALIALYNSTDGDNWTNNTNWRKPGAPTEFNDPGTEHTWHGITTNAGQTAVTEINLSYNKLTGAFADFSAFTELTSLKLGDNKLSGTITTQLNGLDKLTLVSIYRNTLSGSLPDLSSNSSLQEIAAFSTGFSGEIPASLNNIPSLRIINIYSNDLSGAIPDLTNLTNLTELKLGHNSLTGTIPTWLAQLTTLTTLELHYNQLEGTIPDLSNLTSLIKLSIGSNPLTGTIPLWLNTMTSLEEIGLYENNLTGGIPDLSNLVNLKMFQVSNNQLSGSIPATLNAHPALTHLSLNGNQLSGDIPDLSNLTSLQFIFFEKNNLSGNIAGLCSLPAVKWLLLYKNQFSGTIPTELGNLTTLSLLNIGSNMFMGEIPVEVTNLTNISNGSLRIDYNGLYSTNSTIKDFVDTKTGATDWENSQNVAPENLAVSETTSDSVTLTWDAIQYNWDDGQYDVYYSTSPAVGGDYSGFTLAGSTANKVEATYTVTGLDADTQYYFMVKTISHSSANNLNVRESETGTEVSGTTLISKSIGVTAPNGGETWEALSTETITWTHTGDIANVKLEYSTDNGSSWNVISASETNSGSYNWTVPASASATCLVKVSDAAGSATDSSNAVFTIAAERTITVTAPNGGESWQELLTQAITWTHTGAIANVKIEYSTNSGSSWNVISASETNTGTYNWTVPVSPSATCLIKVSDATGSATDSSNAVFAITATPVTPPVTDFTASATTITEGDSITFTDTSTNSPASWSWTFTGGTPASSSNQNPSVTYDNAGTYAVSLTATNAGGSDTMTKNAYITVEQAGIPFETGKLTGVANVWQTVTLNNTYTSPVVVCSNDLGSAGLPAVTRIRNAAGNSFQVMVQNPGGSPLSGYNVYYTVVEEGVYTVAEHGVKMEAVRAASSITAENNSWVTEARSYGNSYTSPVVLGQVMTYNDPDWSVFWANGGSRAASPTAAVFNAGKNVGEDPDNTRANETIAYIVIEAGSGTINDVPYKAGLTSDTIRGKDNNTTGYAYTYGSITNASCVLVGTGAGMDGGNGGWPVLFGASQLTDTSIRLYFDEDQVNDSERKHTPEQVTYIVFGQ